MRTLVLSIIMIAVSSISGAGEGMWLPNQLPKIGNELKAAGLDTPPENFADLTGHPMGAIVSLGGCSASFVSPDGLVATNHHCAYGTIQYNSTAEKNLLETGFLAARPEDELKAAPGSRIYVTVRSKDVTDTVLAAVPDGADGATRYAAIERTEKNLIAECEATPGHRCKVATFFGGAMYRLYDQLEIRDVRLVYAPASSIGKYGGDVDNWMWPRHTGDFAFYRAWVGPDGQPADPSPDNVPFNPEHWLRIGTQGVEENDYVMVVGFPGRTNRYRLASEVEHAIQWTYPRRVEQLAESLEIIDRETEGRPDAQVAYAAMESYINNSMKNAKGMLAGFAHSTSVERKKALESDLKAWIAADPDRQDRWGDVLSDLETLIVESHADAELDGIMSSLKWNQMWSAPATAYRLARENELPDIERSPGYQERDMARIKGRMARMARNYDAQVDHALLTRLFERYAALPKESRLAVLDEWFGLDEAEDVHEAISGKLHSMYIVSDLVDAENRMALLSQDRETLESSEDPFVQLAAAMYDTELKREEKKEALSGQLLEARPRFMEALLAYQRATGREIYPDANSTLRVTFGNVTGYIPRDGVFHLPFTTAEGVAAKATGKEPFDAPESLLDAVAAADFGPYASETLGSLPVNFLSSVDTTGGNSGSATLDSEGRFVGLLFDGNWESMISDWDFLPDVTRSIHVDVRYTLWVMDRIDGAWHLLEEMGVEPAFKSE